MSYISQVMYDEYNPVERKWGDTRHGREIAERKKGEKNVSEDIL